MASTIEWKDQAPLWGDLIAPGSARNSDQLAAFRIGRDDGNNSQSLSTLIESEIIPRLMISHSAPRSTTGVVNRCHVIGRKEIVAFAELVMLVEADAVLAHIESMLCRGIAVDDVMVDLLAPTARYLGELWEEDRCDFVDVTMGLWRLQEVVHEIAGRFPPDRSPVSGAHRALFAAMPGDQHNFGTVVIDEVFRRAGWITDRMSDVETSDLTRRVAEDWFDMVGLTISCDCHIARLPSLIAALRNVSCNPHLRVMVGGRVFSANPDLVTQVGADGTARDARIALKVAMELVREREWSAAATG